MLMQKNGNYLDEVGLKLSGAAKLLAAAALGSAAAAFAQQTDVQQPPAQGKPAPIVRSEPSGDARQAAMDARVQQQSQAYDQALLATLYDGETYVKFDGKNMGKIVKAVAVVLISDARDGDPNAPVDEEAMEATARHMIELQGDGTKVGPYTTYAVPPGTPAVLNRMESHLIIDVVVNANSYNSFVVEVPNAAAAPPPAGSASVNMMYPQTWCNLGVHKKGFWAQFGNFTKDLYCSVKSGAIEAGAQYAGRSSIRTTNVNDIQAQGGSAQATGGNATSTSISKSDPTQVVKNPIKIINNPPATPTQPEQPCETRVGTTKGSCLNNI